METMIITTNNLTAARMAVIAKRTSSDLMAGAKAMMVESLKRQMRGGVAHLLHNKTDEQFNIEEYEHNDYHNRQSIHHKDGSHREENRQRVYDRGEKYDGGVVEATDEGRSGPLRV